MLSNLLGELPFLGLVLVFAAYLLALYLRQRYARAWLNPLLVSIVFLALLLLATDTPYARLAEPSKLLNQAISPVTVCLAVPLYKQRHYLWRYGRIFLLCLLLAALANLLSIRILAGLLPLSRELYLSLLPKSITTAVGMPLSTQIGGIASVTVLAILITGLFIQVLASPLFRLLRLEHPLARGLALGASAHVIGTACAFDLGETEGAMSSIALVLSALLTLPICILSLNWF